MVAGRRSFDTAMKKNSGYEKDHGEMERLLDVLIREIDRKKEAEKEARGEKSERVDAMKEDGAETRAMVTRDLNPSDSDNSPPREKAKASLFVGDSASGAIAATMDRQMKLDQDRLKLEMDRLELAKKQADDAREQQERLMDLIKILVSQSS